MPKTVLIIDDDPKLNQLLVRFLGPYGFKVISALTPTEGLKKLRKDKPVLVILDVMLPEMSGFEVCKKIRRESSIPIIMLTARGDPMDRIVGLELGADDYLPKPFEPRELVARMQAVLRRASGSGRPARQTFGRMTIDALKQAVFLDERQVVLTTNEFAALALLTRHPGEVLDRDRILQELRGMDSEAYNRTVDITMSRLRQKLGDDPKTPEFVKTIWGIGYVFIGVPENND